MTNAVPTLRRRITILNSHGLHARPAAKFVEIANRFDSEITVYKGLEKVNGKSIMGLLTLEAGCGMKLLLEATGGDAQQALDSLCELINDRFGFE